MTYEKSQEAMRIAETLTPGGVNSPVRALRSMDTPVIFMGHGEGSKIYDIGGNEYIDYVLSWGPLILGRKNKQVISKLHDAVDKGTSFSASALEESKLAKLVIERVPSIEKVRIVSSGTETTLTALRLARGCTSRNKIVKFGGCYHGHSDSLLIKAGSGIATLGLPDSPGVPEDTAKNTIIVPCNDLDAIKVAFGNYGNDITDVIVESVAGDMGVIPPKKGFLKGLREVAKEYGSLLIFNEVTTGFCVGYNYAQGYFGVTLDITCLGKMIGGGLPVGAFGGKKEIVDEIAPVDNIYQMGTLSDNPSVMTSSYKALSQLTPESYKYFQELDDILEKGLKKVLAKHSIPIAVNRAGSMVGYFLNKRSVTSFEEANQSDLELFNRIYRETTKEGIFLPSSQFEGTFLSTTHTREDIEKTIHAFDNTLSRIV